MVRSLILTTVINLFRFYSFLMIIYALLSWFPGAYDTFLGRLIANLVEPVIRPFRRLHLQFAGIDFTIIAVFIVMNILVNLLAAILF